MGSLPRRLAVVLSALVVIVPGFARGEGRVALVGGGGYSYGDGYASLGLRFEWLPGLGVGVGGGFDWPPRILTMTPGDRLKVTGGVSWTAPLPTDPYVGAYFARWFVFDGGSALDGMTTAPENAVGGRVGLSVARFAQNGAFVVGAAFERRLACRDRCVAWGPELALSYTF